MVRVMVITTTNNTISVLLVEETEYPDKITDLSQVTYELLYIVFYTKCTINIYW